MTASRKRELKEGNDKHMQLCIRIRKENGQTEIHPNKENRFRDKNVSADHSTPQDIY